MPHNTDTLIIKKNAPSRLARIRHALHTRLGYACLIVGLTFVLRLPALFIPILDIDESQFAGFASVWLDGGLPYQASVDTKPPLIYVFFASVFKIFGKNNLIAVHAVTIVWIALTALAVGALAKQLSTSASIGRYAALFYTLSSAGFAPKFISTSITQLMNLPMVLALVFVVIACSRNNDESTLASSHARWLRLGYFLLSGLSTALAFNFKYQGGISWPASILLTSTLMFMYSPSVKKALRSSAIASSIITLGFIAGVALIWGRLYAIGVWPDFVLWSLKGSAQYIESSASSFWQTLFTRGGLFIVSMTPLVFLTGRTLKKNTLDPNTKKPVIYILITLFLLNLIPVCMGGRFYAHYFLQLLPTLSILAAFAVPTLTARAQTIAIVLCCLFFIPPAAVRFFYTPLMAHFGEETFDTHKRVADALRFHQSTHHLADASLFVWGFATPIYTYSELKPASRFLWADLLAGRSPGPRESQDAQATHSHQGLPQAWTAFWEDVKTHPPTYFVDTAPANLHHYGAYPISDYPELMTFIDTHYRRCMTVESVDVYCLNQ